MTMPIKQVIVIRKDLKMRRGKEITQGAHAAMMFLVKKLVDWVDGASQDKYIRDVNEEDFTLIEQEWLCGSFTKVTCQVNSLEELMAVYEAARAAHLQVHLVTDNGTTEFNGVPTITCLAIGPDRDVVIDPITRHLKLY